MKIRQFILVWMLALGMWEHACGAVAVSLWDSVLSKEGKENRTIVLPTQTLIPLVISNFGDKVVRYRFKAPGATVGRMTGNVDAGSSSISYLRFPALSDPSEVGIDIADGEGALAEYSKVKVWPVTVKFRSQFFNFDSTVGTVEPGKFKNLQTFTIEVTPWTEELKGRLKLGLMRPILGDPRIDLGEAEIASKSSKFTPKPTDGCKAGVTAVVPLLKTTEGHWVECGPRFRIVIQSSALGLPKRVEAPDLELEALLDRVWPHIYMNTSRISQEESLKALKEGLRTYPKIPYLHQVFSDMAAKRHHLVMNEIVGDKEMSYHFALVLAQRAIEYLPTEILGVSAECSGSAGFDRDISPKK